MLTLIEMSNLLELGLPHYEVQGSKSQFRGHYSTYENEQFDGIRLIMKPDTVHAVDHKRKNICQNK